MDLRVGHPGGWLEVICGSMFSGKSEELIRRVKRARIAKQRVIVLKHAIDDRFSSSQVVSHDGDKLEGIPVTNSSDLISKIPLGTQVVAIDEAQFFDSGLVEVCDTLAHSGVRYCGRAGYQLQGRTFRPDAMLRPAEDVTKLNAICMKCAPASRRRGLNGAGEVRRSVVMIGRAILRGKVPQIPRSAQTTIRLRGARRKHNYGGRRSQGRHDERARETWPSGNQTADKHVQEIIGQTASQPS